MCLFVGLSVRLAVCLNVGLSPVASGGFRQSVRGPHHTFGQLGDNLICFPVGYLMFISSLEGPMSIAKLAMVRIFPLDPPLSVP